VTAVLFEIKGLKPGDGVQSFSLEAADEDDAAVQAAAAGYAVLAVKRRPLAGGRFFRRRAFPLVLFSQEMLALLVAGLSLMEVMETLVEKEQRPEARKTLERLIAALYEGKPFSTALGYFPAIFPPLYTATIQASEKTGDLREALGRYVAYQVQLDSVRKKVIGASIYPALLLAVGGLVMLFLMGYVVPRFSSIYENTGRRIPFLSHVLLELGGGIQAHGASLLFGFSGVAGLLVFGLRRPAVKRWLTRRLWAVPAIGERIRIYQLARFYRTLGMLLRGGVPVATGLGMVAGLLQVELREQLGRATRMIQEGGAISQAMEAHALTTPVAVRLLRVGERTGQMGEVMERIAAFYDEEMARWVEWFTRLFEPMLMAVIGLVIGGIVVLMYMPIFDLAGSIQ